jgi:type II secretory pathway pseudopilin PulG
MNFDDRHSRSTIRRKKVAARRGLVIREIVVLTIIPSILASVLLPGVANVREAARRSNCSNNLKQQSLAMHNFESSFKRFPPGCSKSLSFTGYGTADDDGRNLYAWGAHLLPYIEGESLYSALAATNSNDLGGALEQEPTRLLLRTPRVVWRCQSDTSAPILNYRRPFELGDGEFTPMALSNYVAVAGSHDVSAYGNGMFYLNSTTKYADVTDGMSNTLMIGERSWTRGVWLQYQGYAATAYGVRSARERSHRGLADALGGGRVRINFSATSQSHGLGQSYVRRGFSSNHPGGVLFALADGSVQFVASDVDADIDPQTQCARTPEVDSVFERWLCRNDGQSVSEEELGD